ncbi:hypothetical protein BDQ94DRAFT_42372 [Aspergillus welwitschiae]|uniref:Uncharacterized protein n=1 Tax=Aspergillus welwitschiae TaxID=1341132 RepID=A0A3F3Q058_9EURO|nr:hypothetical protein BDQ94DRAFT_42372 [Aspergillus welwitschiae]RDH32465.1 hypothetical protein BDQ94DRAFT_42372 [Aspergillus welwitschiae]
MPRRLRQALRTPKMAVLSSAPGPFKMNYHRALWIFSNHPQQPSHHVTSSYSFTCRLGARQRPGPELHCRNEPQDPAAPRPQGHQPARASAVSCNHFCRQYFLQDLRICCGVSRAARLSAAARCALDANLGVKPP